MITGFPYGPALAAALAVLTLAVAGPGTARASGLADITNNSGVHFLHINGATGEKYACELIGPGGALLDYDGDGDLDLYLVQGAALPGMAFKQAPANALYENKGVFLMPGKAGGPGMAFTPPFHRVHDAAGAGDTGYGMGCAVGDYDRDGDPDLYVTNFGANALYRNDGGRFVNVTKEANVGDPRWSTSATFVDIDHDGWLDLYVCNYFRYRIEDHEWYGLRKEGYRTHGGPASFDPEADILYRNRGDGTFEDVSESSGILAVENGHALGVVAGDFDDDGDQDLYVTNDTQPNSFFLNDGTGKFTEDGMLAGVATDQSGKPQAGMGVDAQDADGDGLVDLFCTNFSLETNTLYRAEAPGFFTDESYPAGLGEAALPYLGFGAGFFDLENDGDLDLFVANGHIMDNVPLYFDNLTYKQRNQLFVNDGGRFREAAADDRALRLEEASRGILFGDLDNDGDTDLIVTDVAAQPQIIRNEGPDGDAPGWIRVILRGKKSATDGEGSDVRLTAAGKTQRRQARRAYGYLTSNDPRVLFGIGGAERAERIEVTWPSGVTDTVESVPAFRCVVITEGEGGRILPEGMKAFRRDQDGEEL